MGRISGGDNRSILKKTEGCRMLSTRSAPSFLNYVKIFYFPRKRLVKFLKDSQDLSRYLED